MNEKFLSPDETAAATFPSYDVRGRLAVRGVTADLGMHLVFDLISFRIRLVAG